MTGGPLCVQRDGGTYYPAGIYVGGTTQSAVRAIDSGVIDLFTRAEISGNGGDNNTGGGITHCSFSSIGGSDTQGALKVTICLQAAVNVGAGWRLSPETSYRNSDAQMAGLDAGNYVLQLKTVSGFQVPTQPSVRIYSGKLTEITFTYLKNVTPPTITSAGAVAGTRGQPMNYQIAASQSPDSYALSGTLPAGLVFNPSTGLISGILQQAGVFTSTMKATNEGGTASAALTITSCPSLSNQNASVPLGRPVNWQVASSESGEGVTYSAVGLPSGVSLDTSSGIISGTPLTRGPSPHRSA